MIAAFQLSLGSILIYLAAGVVIGFLARLLMPGRQRMSFIATILLGAISAVIGGILWEAIFGEGNEGIAWIGSVIVAVLLLWIYGAIAARRTPAGRV